jgi:hypothetical protein
MTAHGRVSTEEATRVGERIGIDWASSSLFRARMEDEADHEWRRARAGRDEAGR